MLPRCGGELGDHLGVGAGPNGSAHPRCRPSAFGADQRPPGWMTVRAPSSQASPSPSSAQGGRRRRSARTWSGRTTSTPCGPAPGAAGPRAASRRRRPPRRRTRRARDQEISALVDRDGGARGGPPSLLRPGRFRGIDVEMARHRTGLLLTPRPGDTEVFGLRRQSDGIPSVAGRALACTSAGVTELQVFLADGAGRTAGVTVRRCCPGRQRRRAHLARRSQPGCRRRLSPPRPNRRELCSPGSAPPPTGTSNRFQTIVGVRGQAAPLTHPRQTIAKATAPTRMSTADMSTLVASLPSPIARS